LAVVRWGEIINGDSSGSTRKKEGTPKRALR
jgi:hypothetical protein